MFFSRRFFAYGINKKTTLGFEIRAVGLNPNASEYAGMSSKRTIIVSMIISGAQYTNRFDGTSAQTIADLILTQNDLQAAFERLQPEI